MVDIPPGWDLKGAEALCREVVGELSMPKKVQIKLLSQSGELLSLTNCAVGQISVLRAESPSELRPYQRALGGSQGREHFMITVDGAQYNPEEHTLIGFGEVAPHAGVTVGQYLTAAGLIEGAISGLLMAYGIEGIESKMCSALSPDEERKVRLFAATADPSKALIINEPFEPIASVWRERIAELLTEFVRTKDGLVVVASLSYRPDTWIDNPVITRHQVGQSLRRTIGFGGADSESTQLMNQLRDQIRNDESAEHTRTTAPMAPPPQRRPQTQAAIPLGGALMLGGVDTEAALESEVVDDELIVAEPAHRSGLLTALKAMTAVSAGGLGVWAAISLLGIHPPEESTAPSQKVGMVQASAASVPADAPAPQPKPDEAVRAAPEIVARQAVPERAKTNFLLDGYPEVIRVSVLDTSRGIMGEPSRITAPDPSSGPQKPALQDSNFYKLLESAGSDKPSSSQPEDGSWQQPDEPAPWADYGESSTEDYNSAEEEERREAIRQKFLEAIRAAADRREQEESVE